MGWSRLCCGFNPHQSSASKHVFSDLRGVASRFNSFCKMFEHHFMVRGKGISTHARHLLSGLLSKQRRKNIECIEADVAATMGAE